MKAVHLPTALVPFLLSLLLCGWSEVTPAQGAVPAPLQPGIVVEKVAKYSEGEKAGMAEGDVLIGWNRGDASGIFRSPFDLVTVEIEQAPHGMVIIDGLRGTTKQRWPLGPDSWGIQTRPNFQDSFLAIYREGQALAASGNQSEAAQKWRAMAGQMSSFDRSLLRLWLLFQTARLHADARQWEKSDEAYQEAIYAGAATAPEVEMQLLISLADTFLKRSDWARAEKSYREAVEKANRVPDSLARALALEYLGHEVRERGDVVKAEDYYLQSWQIRENIVPGSLAEASSLYDLGAVESDRGRLDKSEDYYRRALMIREKLSPGTIEVARNVMGLGNLAVLRSDLTQAEDYYHRALAIYESRAPGSLDVANGFNGLGVVAYARGDLAQEEEYFTKALTIRERLAPGSTAVAMGLHNLGVVAFDRGDLARAEQFYSKALQIKERLAPGSLNVAATLNNLGNVAYDRGDLAGAQHFYALALEIRTKLSPGSLDVGITLDNMGIVAADQGDVSRAENLQLQALAIFEKLSPNSLEATRNLSHLGQDASRRGDLAKAEEYELRALSIQEKVSQTSVSVGWSLNWLAALAQSRGNSGQAEQYYRRAATIWEKLAPGSASQAESLAGLASIMRQRGQWDAAAQLYEQALEALEGQTAKLGGTEDARTNFRGKHAEYYRDYVSFLVQHEKTDYAFQVLERSRARTLLETLAFAHVDIHRGADAALLRNERSLRDDITAKSDRRVRLLSDKHTEEQIAEVDKEISDLRDQYQAVESQIRAASPGYAALTQPEPLTAGQVRQLLDKNTALLEYSLGEERSYIFTVTADAIIAHELPPRAEIERLARNAYDALTARNHTIKGETSAQREARWAAADKNYVSLSAQLSGMVLAPVAANIAGKRLLVVSDGALQYIPFTALPEPLSTSGARVPLIVAHEVVNLPSASVLAVLRQQEHDRKPAS